MTRILHNPARAGLAACACVVLHACSVTAQQPPFISEGADPSRAVKLSAVIGTFLVDAGVRTRGLPWTAGDALPVQWHTPAPVAADAWWQQRGMPLTRWGQLTIAMGDTVAIAMALTLNGNEAGLQRVILHFETLLVSRPDSSGFFVHRGMFEEQLRAEAATLQPLKCSRATEGASYGNLVDAIAMPGKTSSGLWWFWQSPMQMPTLTLSILYRRADMEEAECASGDI